MSQNVNVNLTPGGYPKEFHVSQYDVGRQLVANIVDSTGAYSIPSGATVTLVGTKPSGFGFTLSGSVGSGGVVTFSTTATVTAEHGRIPCEIRITSGSTILGTANCMLIVEESPHPEGTTDGDGEQIIPELTLLVQRVEAAAESIHDLSVSATTLPAGSAATATYDEEENSIAFGIPRGADGEVSQAELDAAVSDLKSDIADIEPSLSDTAKIALLNCFQHVAWTDEHGQDYYDALEDALYTQGQKTLVSISAVFNQGSVTIYTNDELESLKQYLTVTAHYDDSTSEAVSNYTLSGTLVVGTSTITVTYGGKTDTFNVTVTEAEVTLQSISATFNQGSTVIYTNDSLENLKPYLTVTARYSDGTTQTVSNYTLTGSLNAGTSVITVTYGGKTTTFNVTVTEAEDTILYSLQSPVVLNGTSDYIDTDLQLMKTKQSFTIVVDFDDNNASLANEEYTTLFHCMLEDNTNYVYPGVSCHFTGIANQPNKKMLQISYNYNTNASSSFKSVWWDNLANGSLGKIRMACSVNVDTNEMVCYLKVNNEAMAKSVSEIQFASVDETLLIGAYRTQDDVKGRFFNGTINEFKVYDYAFTTNECAAYVMKGE